MLLFAVLKQKSVLGTLEQDSDCLAEALYRESLQTDTESKTKLQTVKLF